MIGYMGWEGVSALVAAGAALIGLVVGRWQLRGALRAADATSRAGVAQAEAATQAGIAQAEASYRAALDAVKATAAESHAQWLRGVRRETYAAFLLSCSELVDISAQLVLDAATEKITAEQRDPRLMEVEAATSRVHDRALIVSLEGPSEIASQAESITAVVIEGARQCQIRLSLHAAWADLATLVRQNDARINRFYVAVTHLEVECIRHRPRTDPRRTPNLPEDLREALNDAQEALLDVPWAHGDVARIALNYACGEATAAASAWAEALDTFKRMRNEFVGSARAMLDTSA
ncbi:hypothetical protein ABZT26_02655 [Streptomyces sp. NPDC005395]|uniref:hypothetical protein n=1 Tax=unclassified Streptomyces TaxID=2593676 RepID=UPI001F1B1ECE|nr:hypothetical protein [Streptomyces sp. BSE6.1]